MKNNRIRFITEMGIFIALGLVFDFLAGLYFSFAWLNGGSISIAMLPIFMMSFRYGLKGGLLSGIAIGTLQIIWASSSALVHWAQVFLEYPLAYGSVGLAGLFAYNIKNQEIVSKKIKYVAFAVILGGTLRTILHIISGYIAFNVPWGASAIYNLGYMVPSTILCLIFIDIIVLKYNHLVEYQEI